MQVRINNSWKKQLIQEFDKPYFKNLVEFVRHEYENGVCYPMGKDIFSAFDYCEFENTRVVIIGQDPYHGKGQANGLCFSVKKGIEMPPSLINIFKEIEDDLKKPMPEDGDLSRWARQGVLLLNSTLTVREGQAGSHQNKGWEIFTDEVIRKISQEKDGVVFMLWGGYAKNKKSLIDEKKHLILLSGHPSPLSANRGHWFGNKHFSKANEYLKEKGKAEIDW